MATLECRTQPSFIGAENESSVIAWMIEPYLYHFDFPSIESESKVGFPSSQVIHFLIQSISVARLINVKWAQLFPMFHELMACLT